MTSVNERQHQRRTRAVLRVMLRVAAPALLIFVLWYLFTSVVRLGYVFSGSMEPTLQVGDYYLLRLDAYNRHGPRRGDIIVYIGPEGDPYIKRVVAVPGDRVTMVGGVVYLNGRRLREPYLKEPPLPGPVREGTVPDDGYLVLGDNRNLSADSRDMGFIPRSAIMGRAVSIVWPRERAGTLSISTDTDAT
ncbi:MAG: signal peptidase I [Armatimonadetes bacterium]|nr:signal peptidase I [Armatimonadota bacterium]